MGATYSDFEQLRPEMLRLATTLLQNARVRVEPEDLVQTVLAEVYRKLQQGKDIRRAKAYAFSSIKNRSLDEIRRFHNKYEQAWPTGPGEQQVWEPIAFEHADELQDPGLQRVFSSLPLAERCFLWRVVFEERAVKEAQKMCSWPDKSPYFHYKKLLEKLRPLLGLSSGDGND